MQATLLIDILIILAASIPVALLLKRLHVPILVGFIITGTLIGHHGFGLIASSEQVDAMAELGLAFLLFAVGLEFSLSNLGRLKTRAVSVALAQILITFLCGLGLGQLLGWNFNQSIYFGCVLALSSSAIVLTLFYSHRMIDSLPGQIGTVVLVIQDLIFVPIIVLLPLLSYQHAAFASFRAALMTQGRALGILVGLFVLMRFLIDPLLRFVLKVGKRELFVITVVVIGLGFTWLAARLGLSFALGAFLGGLLVGMTEFKYQALSEVSPFRFCFNSLFFVSIGMLLNVGHIFEHAGIVALLVVLIPVIKFLVVVFVIKLVRLPLRMGVVTGMALAQIGEFSFLIVRQGSSFGIITPNLYDLIVASAVFTMLLTPLFVRHAYRVADILDRLMSRFVDRKNGSSNFPKTSTQKKQHVVICGFGPLGETLARLLEKHTVPYLVLELNPSTIQELQKQQKEAFYGDGASEEILYRSNIESAALMAITVPDFLNNIAIIKQVKQMNPKIQIITRAKYRNDVEKLYAAGADIVISEELEGGVEMGRYALKLVGIPVVEVDQVIAGVREYGSADFFN